MGACAEQITFQIHCPTFLFFFTSFLGSPFHSLCACAVFSGTVCVHVLENVADSMPDADRKNKLKIEAAIDKFCGQRLSSRDDKMVRCRVTNDPVYVEGFAFR